MIIFCFLLVFIYGVSSIYFANILYYPILIIGFKKSGIIQIRNNRIAVAFYYLFSMWIILSTSIFAIEYSYFSERSMIQLIFTLQYFMLIIVFKISEIKFEKYIYIFSLALATTIIGLTVYFTLVSPSFMNDSLWANQFIPGWPNTIPIPLIFGLWVAFRLKKRMVVKIYFLLALYFTTSRIALIGGLIIVLYFTKDKIKKNIIWLFILIGIMISAIIYLTVINPTILLQLSFLGDRIDIFNTTMKYLNLRPALGFGGNTIDQLVDMFGNFSSIKNWGHTHNFILEVLLRYGTIGAILFLGFIISLFIKIKDKEKKFLFLLFIATALFQTYMRDFVFLFFLNYLSTNSEYNLEQCNVEVAKQPTLE